MSAALLALDGDLPRLLGAGEPDVLAALRRGPGDAFAALVLGAEGRPLQHDPVALATAVSVRLPGWPVLVASDGQRDHPYNAARRFLALDHLSGGRSGVVFNGGASAAHTAERIRVIRALWNSWPRDSLVSDRESGLYARTDSIRAVAHSGAHYRVAGALNSPSSRQGEPVSVWHVQTQEELTAADGLVDFVIVGDAALARVWSASSSRDRPRLAELVRVNSLEELEATLARVQPTDDRSPHTLRARLGLPDRSVDLSDNPLAFGAARA